MCQNRDGIGPVSVALGHYKSGVGTLWHSMCILFSDPQNFECVYCDDRAEIVGSYVLKLSG